MAVGLLDDALQVGKIVAIARQDAPAKRLPFARQIAERHDVLGASVDLLSIAIDERQDVVDLVVGGVHGSFPDLAFLQFAVAVERVHPCVLAIQCLDLGSTECDGQTLTQGARGHADAWEAFFRGGVALEAAVELSKGAEFFHREVSASGEHAVPHGADVPVGQEEDILTVAVHVERIRVDVHGVEVQLHQQIGAPQGATGVTTLHCVDHADDVAANLRRKRCQFCGIHGAKVPEVRGEDGPL